MGGIVLAAVGIFLVGILAGEEFVVRYGVQSALTALDDRAHILARKALIGRLRVLVPLLMVPTVVVGIAVTIVGGPGPGIVFRWAGAIALIAFVLASFLGTVPINMRVNDWDVEAPPGDWRAVIRRWERIDLLRSSAAILAFACHLAALVLQLGV